MRHKVNTPLLFLDVETTGLDPEKHQLLEIAAVMVDTGLNHIGKPFERLVATPRDSSVLIFDDAALLLALESGLLAEWAAVGYKHKPLDVYRELLEWVESKGVDKPVLAGSNPTFDRKWLAKYFPDVEALLHYRTFDLNTFYLSRSEPKPESPHRAFADVLKDIDFLREVLSE